MTSNVLRLMEGAVTPLSASLLAGMPDGGYSPGLPVRSAAVLCDAGGVTLEKKAAADLGNAIDCAAQAAGFWTTLGNEVASRTAELTAATDELAELSEADPSNDALAAGLDRWIDVAGRAAATALVAAAARDRLGSAVAEAWGEDVSMLDRLAWSGRQPEAIEAVHDLYRVAVRISENDAAAGIVREMSGKGALRRLRSEHPDLHGLVASHAERFGWLRAQSGVVPPATERELMQRVSIALVRWDGEMLARAAKVRKPAGGQERAEDSRVRLLQDLTTGPEAGVQLLGRAQGQAWPVLTTIAQRFNCSPEDLAFCTIAEIQEALTGKELPLEQAIRRRESGFTVEVDGASVLVHEEGPRPATVLEGQTGSMGRAVGRAKIILHADDGGRLKEGDVLITDLSTPTYEGDPSLFPYRTVPSFGIEKSAAVVTDEGGLLSHAGIICRENSVPSLIGAEGATTTVKDGQVIEVDATKGAGRTIVWSSPMPPPGLAAAW